MANNSHSRGKNNSKRGNSLPAIQKENQLNTPENNSEGSGVKGNPVKLAQLQDYIVRRVTTINALLTSWEDCVGKLTSELEKDMLHKGEAEGVTPQPTELQREFVKGLGNAFLHLMAGKELNFANASEAERLFKEIASLVYWSTSEKEDEVCERMTELAHSYRAETDANHLAYLQAVNKYMEPIIQSAVKFHQLPNQNRERFYKAATERFFERLRDSKSKRGYTFGQALQDENLKGGYIPETEFDRTFVEIENYYKTWRSRNKKLVRAIEQRFNVVTKMGTSQDTARKRKNN